MRPGAAAILLLGAVLAVPAAAQQSPEPQRQLREVQRTIESERARQAEIEARAEALRKEIERLRQEAIVAARALQAEEYNLSTVEETLAALVEEIERQTAMLAARRQSVEALIVALVRIARHPPEALLALPAPPIDTARTAGLLAGLVPQVEREAAKLRDALADLRELRADMEARRGQAATARGSVDRRRVALDALIAQRTIARGEAEAEARRRRGELQQLAARAADLKELIAQAEAEAERKRQEAEAERRRQEAEAERRRREIAAAEEARRREAAREESSRRSAEAQRLEMERRVAEQRRDEEERRQLAAAAAQRPPALRPFAAARGHYRMPVAGQTQRGFGDDLGYGQHSRGMTVITRAGARVVAPFDGRVLFIGPFRAYGEILIIEHGDGYHSLLAGLGRTDGTVGQTVLAGEPVGIMATDGEERPKLYIELRRNGTPINPQPWLAASDGKESG
ncbi:MAG: peptidoglycan DD-metalloendopeptidase family protein [Alphaproteobacteria bacterium]|nr:peptidoglycan DD-metalloendopeptidase family protein [Alphaproteobacteria bacterium]